MAEDLSRLPPALLVVAEFDVLRDQARAYAQRLTEAGVPIQYSEYAGVLHDFVTLPGLFDRAWDAIGEITTALRTAFHKGARQ